MYGKKSKKKKQQAAIAISKKKRAGLKIKKQEIIMSLYENINRRKRLGISRSKKKSSITNKAYANMQAGFPKKKRKNLRINT